MRRSSVSISLAFHAACFVLAVVSIPWLKKDYVIPTPVSVELVAIDKMAQTTKVAPTPVKKQEKKEEQPTPPKPPPPKQNTSTEPTPPTKEIKKEEVVKKEEKVLVDPAAHPDKKLEKKDEKKKKVTEEPKKSFDSLLKNLADEKVKTPTTPTPDMKLDESTPKEGQNIPLGERMTMTEMDALREQLRQCWNFPMGAKDADNLLVEIDMVVTRDRTLQSAKVVDMARYNSDSFFRAAADSAMRAVRNVNCSPFELPPDKYDTWKTITVTFDPRDLF